MSACAKHAHPALRGRRPAPRRARPWSRRHRRRRSCASAPPMVPGMPRRKASPAMPASAAARATLTSGSAGAGPHPHALARPRSSAKPCRSRITTPGTPPSRTSRFEPSPTTQHRDVGRASWRGNEARSSLVGRREQHLGRPAGAKPGRQRRAVERARLERAAQGAPRRVGRIAARWHRRRELGRIRPAPRRLRVRCRELARQRIGPLRDVAGAEADHVVAGLASPATRPARSSGPRAP